MALCGFNKKILGGMRDVLDGAIEHGIIDRAKKRGVSINKQFRDELNEISQWNYFLKNVHDGPTQKQIEGIGLLIGGTFEKDMGRGISNYVSSHASDTAFLEDIDNYYYNNLEGNVKNMPKLFDWVNENLEKYRI